MTCSLNHFNVAVGPAFSLYGTRSTAGTPTAVKGKAVSVQAWTGPEDSRRHRLPNFMTVGKQRLSALCGGSLHPPANIRGTHFCWRLGQPQGHSAAERIMSTINSNDTIGNRTRELQDCSTMPQPTAPSCAPLQVI